MGHLPASYGAAAMYNSAIALSLELARRCSATCQRCSAESLSSELRNYITFSFGVRFEKNIRNINGAPTSAVKRRYSAKPRVGTALKNIRNINGAPTSAVRRCSAVKRRYSAKPRVGKALLH
ncbi:uncharacterized protein G2W53_044517 [Senna tora]|uniref:Uncharacterized protein n=1 Tax=Senna tora TaxID=362788 RepID=A0A834SCT6_9FABA|nr:uncharacterized protein G2W53_044517 [Senna tora]